MTVKPKDVAPLGAIARRRFLAAIPAALGASLAAGAAQEQAPRVSKATLDCAEKIIGVDFTDAEEEAAAAGVSRNLDAFERLRNLAIPLDTEPAITLPSVPAWPQASRACRRQARSIRMTSSAHATRPQSLDELAFLPITALAPLIERRDRLGHRSDEDVPGAAEEIRAEAELRRHAHRGRSRSRRRRRPIAEIRGRPIQRAAARHPVGREGSLRHEGHPDDVGRRTVSRIRCSTTTPRSSNGCATPARCWSPSCRWARWRRATSGSADRRGIRGTLRPNPRDRAARRPVPAPRPPPAWSLSRIGTETRGSIISPSSVNGVTGLRPTYGRVSRHGAMALSWTMDKIGPMCRSVEDCALVFNAIYGPDGRDETVVDAPFVWNPTSAGGEAAHRICGSRVQSAAGGLQCWTRWDRPRCPRSDARSSATPGRRSSRMCSTSTAKPGQRRSRRIAGVDHEHRQHDLVRPQPRKAPPRSTI